MQLHEYITKKLLENKLTERICYTNPHIDKDTKNVQIVVTYDPQLDEIPRYDRCRDIAIRRVQKKNPRLVCTSYQSNIRRFKSGRNGWIFYFSEE